MTRLAPVKRLLSNTGVRIYRIPCDALPELPGRVYLLLGAGSPTLVDTGSGEEESLRHVLEGLDRVRNEFGEPVRLEDLRRIVLTHAHFDHVGGLPHLRWRTEAAVGIHPLDRRVVEAWDERSVLYNRRLRDYLLQVGVDAAAQPELIRAFGFRRGRVASGPVDFELEDGAELDGLRFIHTPGHSSGHTCILVGNVLLTGDHILPRTVTQQWPEAISPYTGLGHYLESLEKVRRIEGIETAMGGHEPTFHNFYERCDEVRHSHLRRLDRLLEIVRKSPQPPTVYEMTEPMYARQKGFYAMLAVLDVGARVEYLEQRGRLAVVNYDDVERSGAPRRYRPA